jgi:hypothetical protein
MALLALYDGLSRINASGVLLLTGLTDKKAIVQEAQPVHWISKREK